MASSKKLSDRRTQRTRLKIRKRAGDRPRLSVFRSGKHIYAQIIDDFQGITLATASTIEKDVKGKIKTGAKEYFIEEISKEMKILYFFPIKKNIKAQKHTILKLPTFIRILKGFDIIKIIIEKKIIKF